MDELQISRVRDLFPCFATVPETRWAKAELIEVAPSTPHAIREGRLLEHAMFIVGGGVRIYKIGPSTGREITLYRVFAGQCCALMMASALGETEYEASAAIEVLTEVFLLPIADFKSWVDDFKPVRQYVYKQIISRITDVTNLLENVAFQSIPCRLADFLLIRSSAREKATLRLTHEQVAAELGTAREVVSRTLKSFAAKGTLALKRGEITVLSPHNLQAIAEQRP